MVNNTTSQARHDAARIKTFADFGIDQVHILNSAVVHKTEKTGIVLVVLVQFENLVIATVESTQEGV